MTIQLEALSPAEGAGIVRVGDALRLVRPPYRLDQSPVLPGACIQDAILKHGYSASTEAFSTWEDLIEFLNRQARDARLLLGHGIPDTIAAEDIIGAATPAVLSVFLDRVRTELIPRRLFKGAEAVLLAILASSIVKAHPALLDRAVKLLAENHNARERAAESMAAITARDLRFESLERHGELGRSGMITGVIRDRGCIFAGCS